MVWEVYIIHFVHRVMSQMSEVLAVTFVHTWIVCSPWGQMLLSLLDKQGPQLRTVLTKISVCFNLP